MGITRRLFDLARSNLTSLIDPNPARGDGSLGDFTDDELKAELELRELRRKQQEQARAATAEATRTAQSTRPAGTARPAPGTPPPRTREQADREAREWVAREQAKRAGRSTRGPSPPPRASSSSSSSSSSASSAGTRRPPPVPSKSAKVAALYAQLETPVGATLETVKKNFRRLMRQHHPDVNGGSPERLKAATEKSMALTSAYQELERILGGGSR